MEAGPVSLRVVEESAAGLAPQTALVLAALSVRMWALALALPMESALVVVTAPWAGWSDAASAAASDVASDVASAVESETELALPTQLAPVSVVALERTSAAASARASELVLASALDLVWGLATALLSETQAWERVWVVVVRRGPASAPGWAPESALVSELAWVAVLAPLWVEVWAVALARGWERESAQA